MPKRSRKAPSGPPATASSTETVDAPKRKRRPTKAKAAANKEFGNKGSNDEALLSNFRKAAKKMKGAWKEAESKSLGGMFEPPDIDDGTYLVQVVNAAVKQFGSDGDYFLEIVFSIVKGPHEGVDLRENLTISLEPAFGEFSRIDLVLISLRNYGIKTEKTSPEAIPEMANELNGLRPYARVGVKNDYRETVNGTKHYQNIRFQSLITADDVASF